MDKDVAIRVKQFADKQDITNREAYRQLLTWMLDEEGNLNPEITEVI